MQTASSETESKSRDLSICVHHYTLRAPCPKGQGTPHIFYKHLHQWLQASKQPNVARLAIGGIGGESEAQN